MSALVEHGDQDLDLHRVKVALYGHFIDGKGFMSLMSRQNRHNRLFATNNRLFATKMPQTFSVI